MTTKTTIEGVPRYIGEARIVGLYYPARCTKCGWLGSSEDLTDEAECTRHEGDRLCLGYTEEVDAVYLLGVVQAMAKTAAPLHYGSLDAVQRLALCRGDMPVAAPVVPELTPELRWILGQMCFQHIHTAQALRLMGHEIARKAEDEQAVTIYWMLGHYLKDPANWRDNAAAEMKAAAPKA